MAKILYFNIPGYGHVNATLPVVAELTRRGHEVIYYCGTDFQGAIESAGGIFRPYPIADLDSRMIVRISRHLANVSSYLLKSARTLAPFAIAEIEREQPDLVMYDAVTIWGRIAAAVTGTPSIASYTVMVNEGRKIEIGCRKMAVFAATAIPKLPGLAIHRRALIKAYGEDIMHAPLFPSKAQKNIEFILPSFQPESQFVDDSFVQVGPSIDPALRQEAPWQPLDTALSQVLISLGTVNNRNTHFYRTAFAAFADYPAQFILSAGKLVDMDQIGAVPGNFLVKESVPQLQVLQQSAAFITHGGMNSVQEGLYYGVPLVVVPQQMEQFINGKRVAELGAGVLLDKGDGLTPEQLRSALDTVLTMPSYTQAARALGQEGQAAGGYVRAADEIEAFLGRVSKQFIEEHAGKIRVLSGYLLD